jgi:hypothetical protein
MFRFNTATADTSGLSAGGLLDSLVEVEGGDDVHDAALVAEAADDGCASLGDPTVPHCACAFCITLLLSSRNIKDS